MAIETAEVTVRNLVPMSTKVELGPVRINILPSRTFMGTAIDH